MDGAIAEHSSAAITVLTANAESLDPQTDAAKIRAIFVHPDFARRGLGSLILTHCEQAAIAAGFRSFEMGSTLTGVPLYTLRGYREESRVDVPLPNGCVLPIVRMSKQANAPCFASPALRD